MIKVAVDRDNRGQVVHPKLVHRVVDHRRIIIDAAPEQNVSDAGAREKSVNKNLRFAIVKQQRGYAEPCDGDCIRRGRRRQRGCGPVDRLGIGTIVPEERGEQAHDQHDSQNCPAGTLGIR